MLPNQQILCPNCHQPDYPGVVFCANCGHDMVLNNAGPRYYITRVVKAGGQGSVYEGIGEDGKVYAIKEMLENFADPKERSMGMARFQAEARLLQRLSHPRIPRVYDYFDDEGRHYLTMDFIRGQDLEDVADQRGAIPEREVLGWAEQICDVLGYLHANGLIYRDMKPSNVMLEADGGIKVVDFGIAKVLQPTKQGTQVGTPGYAPPEQYQGLASATSDVFALAATLHHLLTGRDPTDQPPFSFPPARSLVPTISQRTSDALQRALQMNPEDRFPTVAAFWDALQPQSVPVPAAQPKPATRPAPAARPAPGTQPVPPTQPAPQVQARPAGAPAQPVPAPAQPALPTPPWTGTPAAQPATPRRRRSGVLIGLGLLLALIVAGTLLLNSGIATLPGVPSWSTPTPQTLLAQELRFENVEIIVPLGTDTSNLRSLCIYTFETLARQRLGQQEARLQEGSFDYVGGPPQRIRETSQGTTYRVSMRGIVLTPKS